jgi:mRNA interferase MazF
VTSPPRGEVWLVDLGLAAKVRPALVISIPPGDADRALVTLVPHTTSTRGSRFEITVPVPFLRQGAFDAQSLVTIPLAKLIRRLGRLNPVQLVQVEQGVCSWLGIVGSGQVQEQAGDWPQDPNSQG